jgi:hypothetical protein
MRVKVTDKTPEKATPRIVRPWLVDVPLDELR